MSNEDHIRVVVSGAGWVGGGLGSIETALYRLFNRANDEVTIVAYTISGSATALFQQIERVLQRGVRVRMIVNRYSNQHVLLQRKILELEQKYAHIFHVFSFVPASEEADLHAKIVLVDRQQALVGSANLSLRGLIDNHELGLIVEGSAAMDIAKAIDQLMKSPFVVTIFAGQ